MEGLCMFDLTPYGFRPTNIFKAFDDFEKNFFSSFDSDLRDFRTDIIDNGNSFALSAELPGFDKNDINIDIKDDILTISAVHNEEKDEKDSKGNYIRRERSYGAYTRSFNISNINTDEIKAEYKNGILHLDLPKIEEKASPQKRIEIS